MTITVHAYSESAIEYENEYEYVSPYPAMCTKKPLHVLVLVLVLVHILVLVLVSGLHAQELPELVTDRPDQTESAETVPAGWLQIEAGAVMENAGAAQGEGVRMWTLPGVLLRWGVSHDFELRLASAFVTDVREVQADDASSASTRKSVVERGTEPLSLGLKYRFLGGGLPSVALIAMFALPSTTAGDFPSNNPATELRLTVAQDLDESFSLGCNLAIERDLRETRNGLHYTLVAGADISEKTGAFIELFGSRDTGDDRFRHRADGGVTYLISTDLQADAAAGFELNPPAGLSRGWFAGIGISWRFPLDR